VSESTQVASQRATRAAALQTVLGMQVPWDVTLGQVARVMPEGSWLTTLSALSPTPATVGTSSAASPTNFTLTGYAPTHAAVSHLLERLALVPSLGTVALESTQSTPIGKKTVVQFNITASVQHALASLGGLSS
jgi:Tfp pilus assembly protein PilN